MFNKLKKYLAYRKNVKTAKREFAKMLATALPVVRSTSDRKVEMLKFVINLVNETKNMDSDKLVKTVLSEVSNALQTSNGRLIEIFSYIASLTPMDVQKILVHAVAETNKNTKNDKNI